jgi:hypothetical protein
MTQRFPDKDPAERLVLRFDLSAELDAGETAVSAVVSIGVATGGGADANAAAMLSGVPTVLPSGMVLQMVQGGLVNVTYRVKAVLTLSSGRVLAMAAQLPVRDV